MPRKRRPNRGSHGYSPRVRSRSETPRMGSWPEDEGEPHVQGFAGYKAGMTHVLLTDYRPTSATAGQEVMVPVTVVEVPTMRVAGVRFYERDSYGLRTITEAWAKDVDARLAKRLTIPRSPDPEAAYAKLAGRDVEDVRLLAYTQPGLVGGIPKKTPDIMELRVGGTDLAARIEFSKGLLGKELKLTDVTKVGQMVDVVAVTKGHGYQGSVVRWGVRLQSHKNSKNRRDASPLGPFTPRFIRSTVPMPGQTGYHKRTEYNKRVLKIGENGDEVTPKGGFPGYGPVKNPFVMLHGSIPGPAKRIIRFRPAIRYHAGVEIAEPQLTYVSTASKQGA